MTAHQIVGLSLVLAIIAASLTGCHSIDSEPYGKEEVLTEVASTVPTEAYELVSVKTISEKPKNVEYTFRSTDRDLTFTANSTLHSIGIDATDTAFYQKEILCSYVQEVHRLYAARVREELSRYEVYDSEHDWVALLNFADVEEAAAALAAASQIYAEELTYNSADFLRENPVTMIHAAWFPNPLAREQHGDWVNLCNTCIDGVSTEQDYYEALARAYGTKVLAGEIGDDSAIPEEYLELEPKK